MYFFILKSKKYFYLFYTNFKHFTNGGVRDEICGTAHKKRITNIKKKKKKVYVYIV